ncbi:hypothetical protein BDW75DRAFT_234723 [Aspergillus navahoensis]
MPHQDSVATKGNGSADTSTLKVLDVVSKLEPSRGPSYAHWWKLTGPQLALMLQAAKYPIEKQFETLLFYYHWIATSGPNVRLTIEPINEVSGTRFDPLNQSPSLELLQRVADILPLVCFQFGRNGTTTKRYMSPRKLGQQGFAPLPEFMSAIAALGPSRVLTDSLNTSPEGPHLNLSCWRWTTSSPPPPDSSSTSPRRAQATTDPQSPDSRRPHFTPILESKLRALHELVKAIMPFPPDLPDDADIPVPKQAPALSAQEPADPSDMANQRPAFVAGYQYYFDIAPGTALPDIKFYLSIRKEKMNDRTVTTGLVNWMRAQGRGPFCDGYIRENGYFDVTSYLAPGCK